MLRILHTSDWHIGATYHGASRAPEHAAFFAWLLEQVQAQDIDALVVAGDVFDRAQPSNEALAMYYDLLLGLRGTRVKKVVIVGGNHDSPSQLEAPEQLLGHLDVHVLGGWDERRADRHVIGLSGESGAVEAALVAVPFVSEWQLGARSINLPAAELREQMRTALASLYSQLCDEAQRQFPGAPLLGTGHLTVDGFDLQPDDAPRQVHYVGKIAGLPGNVFDRRLRYLALGHIHRPMSVLQGRGRYCGTPIPLSINEMSPARQVVVVQVDGDDVRSSALDVPITRALRPLEGTIDELLDALSTLRWPEPRPPLLSLRAHVQEAMPDADRLVADTLEQRFPDPSQRPVIAELRQLAPPAEALGAEELPDVDSLSLQEVFALLVRRTANYELDEPLQASFDQVLSEWERRR